MGSERLIFSAKRIQTVGSLWRQRPRSYRI